MSMHQNASKGQILHGASPHVNTENTPFNDRDRARRSRSPPRRRYSRSRSPPLPRRERSPPRAPAAPGCLLFVAGFTFITDERDLERKFEKYGEVKTTRVVRGGRGESRGFGFIEMKSPRDAEEAVRSTSGVDWNGRKILVEVAKRP